MARAACQIFTEKGYRRTLMTDVGAELGLSHALLYRYVDGKEALFELALRYAIDEQAAAAISVPVPTPPTGHMLGLVRSWSRANAVFPVLASALDGQPPADAAAELLGIIDERYAFVERNRRVLALIERSALDIPDLHALYFTKGRRNQTDRLARYLDRRIRSGHLRPVPDAGVAARFIGETIAWFAWHRKDDPDSAMIGDEPARQTVRELLVTALAVPGRAGRKASRQ